MQTWLSGTHVFNRSTAECVTSLSNGRPAIGSLVSPGTSPVIDVLFVQGSTLVGVAI